MSDSTHPGSPAPRIKIRIEALDFQFTDGPKAKKIVEDFNLVVHDQEFLSIVGASGCGKSTLLNILAGFLPPTHGCVWLDDELITKPDHDRAMVFQDDAVFPWFTVRQNVEYGLKMLKMQAGELKAATEHYLELVGLKEAESLFPRQLSGGMRKRVDMARALAIRPEVLLMDEPFAALDVLTKGKLQEQFLDIWNNNRMTVIFVTHDLEEALFLSDRVVVMSNNPGRVRRVVDVPFARPRDADLKTSPEFQAMRRELGRELDQALPTLEARSEFDG